MFRDLQIPTFGVVPIAFLLVMLGEGPAWAQWEGPRLRSGETTYSLESRKAGLLAAMLRSSETFESKDLEFRIFRELSTTPTTPRRPITGGVPEMAPSRFVPTSETISVPYARQALGPLTGHVIYTSGGHGWTNDNTSTGLWHTQRPALLGMVEDFGNQDQLTLFADAVFRAGATVVPMRPVGHQTVERVLDNSLGSHVKFEGQWADGLSDRGFRLQDTTGPAYRVAQASLVETAVVRYRPRIPVQDWYPIYAWANHGPDRVPQTYRIVVGASATEVIVDHRLVGSGWVYLGEYFLPSGTDSYVEIPNTVSDAVLADGRHLVVADAIRFGNGRGDINRGGGISGKPREDEAGLYWIARALPERDRGLAFWSEADASSTVGAPPRMAAYMNRETSVTTGRAVFIGWHSNAKPERSAPQRGALTLLTRDATSRTLLQEPFAAALVDSINALMSHASGLPVPWVVQPQRIVSFINYGEIRIDSIGNEMPATIVESAFHDQAEDVELLLDVRARRLMADGAVSGTIAFMRSAQGLPPLALEEMLPPNQPQLFSVEAVDTTPGLVRIAYEPSLGGGRLERLVLESGRLNGGFSPITNLAQSGSVVNLGTSVSQMVRLVGEGPGGRSLPSRILFTAALPTTAPKVLLITAFDAEDRSQSLVAEDPGPFNFPTGPAGTYTRVSPRLINSYDQAVEVGRLLVRLGARVNSVHRSFFESMAESELSLYGAVIYMEGRQTVPKTGLTTTTLDRLERLSTSVPVLVSGSAIVRPRPGEEALRTRLAKWAGVNHVGVTSQTGRLFLNGIQPITSGSVEVQNRLPSGFLPEALDMLGPSSQAEVQVVALHDEDERRAVYVFRRELGKPIRAILAAPLEHLSPTSGRLGFLRRFLEEAKVTLVESEVGR